jgi:hypothetical protein
MVELIPKPKQEILAWEKILNYGSWGFLALVGVALVILAVANDASRAQLKKIDQELFRGKSQEERSLENNILSLQRRFSIYRFLLNSQKPINQLFLTLEKNTHPQAFFNKFEYVGKDSRLWLSGKTDNFQTLGQQQLLFQKEAGFAAVNLAQAEIGREGLAGFNFEIFLSEDFFKNQP